MMKVLVTGSAGFIGANLVLRLLETESPIEIVGFDSVNNYYDVRLKEYRLAIVEQCAAKHRESKYTFVKGNLADKALIDNLFTDHHFDIVVNLAAQGGVRYCIMNPDSYIESNVVGFYNILEACRHHPVQHLVYASSSSVYGGNTKVPFSTDDNVDHPVSLYAATKKSNELLKGEKIQLYNYGNCQRDFTYIDDIVEGIVRMMKKPPECKTGGDGLLIPPYAIYNIGAGKPVNLFDFVRILQEKLVGAGVIPKDFDFDAHKELVPMQAGDVPMTYADVSDLERDFGFAPKVTLQEGLERFAKWYRDFYN